MSVNRKKRNRPASRRWISLLWGIFFFVLILWVAYNRAPQIEKHLDTPFSVKEWLDEKIELVFPGSSRTEKPRFHVAAHYENLEIPAPFTDDRADEVRCYAGYALSYNNDWRLPNWVAYELLRSELNARVPRRDDFRPDEGLKGGVQASLSDYRRSGFDRGHMAPAADMRWSATAMSESFYLTNICPQTPSFNQGDWNRLEGKIRDWARRDSAVVIVCGPLVSVDDTTIGPNKVKVPRAFYKVVVSPYVDPPQGIGFVFENTFERRRLPLADYVVSIDSVEILTGIDFFPALPDDIENFVESRYDTEYWNF